MLSIADAIARAVNGHRLLDHPFYQRWQRGELAISDIGDYASQYRHFESVLPDVLRSASQGAASGATKELIDSNLRDELSQPEPHIDLFDRFAAAVIPRSQACRSPATARLVEVYRAGASAGPVPALAVIAGYETQAAEIAATKSQALRDHYGLGVEHTRFWDIHATIEQSHATWTIEALEQLGADTDVVQSWAGRSATAWWAFLDERDASSHN